MNRGPGQVTGGNWKVRRASRSARNSGLCVEGDNLLNGEQFYWDIDHYSIGNVEYDFSACEFADDAARATYDHLVTLGRRTQ